MRTFQVVNVRWHNATAWYALYLSRLLTDAGHETLVLALPDTEPEARARELGLEVAALDLNTMNPARMLPAYGEAARLVRRFRPQVVNCHRGEGFVLWGLMKRLGLGFKLVRTRGDQRPPKNDPVNRWLHSRVADAVVATNGRMARHFLDAMRVPEPRLWLIRGGVDTERFAFDPAGRERVRAELGYGPGDVVVGLVGRFDRVKGQREALESLARLRAAGRRDLRLLLAGFGSATPRETVEGWVRELGLSDVVRITGRRGDMPAVISACDVGLVASLWSETIARAALELMACGRPLVSTTVGVMPDLVPPAGLYEPGDPAGMDRVIAQAAENEIFRTRLREAQARTLTQLTGEQFLRRTLSLYESLTGSV
ncbi:MAG: glycosyltransferase family 4 protein [Desulfovibrionaceae bacterium]